MKRLITFFALIAVWTTMALAHDFFVNKIYYVKNSDGTSVSVSYKGTSYGEYSNEYSGSVTIPPSVAYSGKTYDVTSIGDYAFYNCSGLTSVTIPNSVTSIGDYAFYNCSGLTSVTIPNSVTSIGNHSFQNCSGLTSVTIPNSVKSIDYGAFYNCSGLTSVTIPNSVTSIGSFAFYRCSGLTSVTIGNSVTSIGESAFSFCNLTSVTIPNSVTSIGYGAFSRCRGLKSIEIPNSVKTIGDYAFYGCSGLTSVTIGNSVTSIGGSTFKGCSGLKTVNWNAKNCEDFTEDKYAPFYGLTGITAFNFGNNVQKVPAYLCNGLTGLTSVTIPNSVTSIEKEAFGGCSGLKKVEISDLVAWCNISFNSNSASANPLVCAKHLFLNGSEIIDLVIPNSVTSIGDWTFYNCSGLTSVTIGNSVTSIGSSAFQGCNKVKTLNTNSNCCASISRFPDSQTALNTLTIGNSVTSIGSYAFRGCSGLTSVTIGNSVTSIGNQAFSGCSGLTSVTIGNSVTSIGDSAFNGCSGLTTITFPNSVKTIGERAFYGCTGLISIINPYNIKTISRDAFHNTKWFDNQSYGNLVYIGNVAYCFKGQYSPPQSMAIREGTVSISPYCFYGVSVGYSGIETTLLDIPNSVEIIGEYAFCNSYMFFRTLKVGASVTEIGKEALRYGGLTNTLIWNAKNCNSNGGLITKNINLVSIGNGVEVLPNGFVEGSQITDVTIPGSVKTIGDNAFASCSKLSTVTNYALTPQSINESVFQNVDVSFCTLYVPAESNSLYASANVWKDFFIQNAGVEGVEVDKSTKEIEGYYNLHGIRIKEPIRGQVNIVRYSDGSAEKLVIKE